MQWVQQAEAFKPSKYLTPSLVTSQLQCEPSESIPTPRLIIHTANEEFVCPRNCGWEILHSCKKCRGVCKTIKNDIFGLNNADLTYSHKGVRVKE